MLDPDDPPLAEAGAHRKKLRLWETGYNARFMTFSCYQRMSLLGTPTLRDEFVDAMRRAREKHGFELFAWVVMPEHAHMLFRPPDGVPWSEIGSTRKISMAKRVIGRWRKLDAKILPSLLTADGDYRFWQHGGGFDRNVRHMKEFTKEIRYIHRNPLERELVTDPAEWKWSSVHWWNGHRGGALDCDPPLDTTYAWDLWKGYV